MAESLKEDPKFRHVLNPPIEVDQQKASNVLHDITDKKKLLCNLVCSFLLKEPKFFGDVEATKVVQDVVEEVAKGDPEFILKLALYVRSILGIRGTANFLLALASNIPECRQFLRLYFSASTNLPSDVLEVVDCYRKISGKKSPPSALKSAIQEKFKEFSIYQLGKYNTETADKRRRKIAKAKEAKEALKNPKIDDIGSEDEGETTEGETTEGEGKKAKDVVKPVADKPITIKELIQICHISEPVLEVMSLLRKKYPKTQEEFEKSKLPGTFNPEQAGKKLRIPIPVTWETELAKKGNRAVVWEDLITGKNLPFMAMMRNLRNCLQAGINDKCHDILLGRLTDEKQVVSSKQLPIRFLSSYEAIDFKEEDLKTLQEYAIKAKENGTTFREEEVTVGAGKKTKKVTKKKYVALNPPTQELLVRYKDAIDEAVKLSTLNNVPALRGNVLILVDVSGSMDTKLSFGPKRKHVLADIPHAKCTGKPMLEGEEYCLEDYFTSRGQHASRRLSMSMIWIGRDLDLSCAVLDKDGNTLTTVSYSSLEWNGIKHSGDITDAPMGAEEIITLDLDAIPAEAYCVMFTVNSYSGETFDQMKEAAISLRDDGVEGGEICAFRLAGTGGHRALIACSVYRKQRGWSMRCLNTPQDKGMTVATLATKISKEFNAQQLDSGKETRRLVDVAILTSLCIKYASESCKMYMFASPPRDDPKKHPSYVEVKIEGDSILENVKKCHQQRKALDRGTVFPIGVLNDVLKEKDVIDYLIVVSDMTIQPNEDKYEVSRWLRNYRMEVNPDLTFVCMDLLGKGSVGVDLNSNPNDVLLTGYSDQVLRYIGDLKMDQVAHVESMQPPPKKEKKERI